MKVTAKVTQTMEFDVIGKVTMSKRIDFANGDQIVVNKEGDLFLYRQNDVSKIAVSVDSAVVVTDKNKQKPGVRGKNKGPRAPITASRRTQIERQRRNVYEILAAYPMGINVPSIIQHLTDEQRKGTFHPDYSKTSRDVSSALNFMKSRNWVDSKKDVSGPAKLWFITQLGRKGLAELYPTKPDPVADNVVGRQNPVAQSAS